MTAETPTAEKSEVRSAFDKLAQMRDELRLHLHLGKAAMRDEWDRLEPKWEELKKQLDKVEMASVEAGREVGVAAKLLMADLKESYERLSKKL